MLEAALLIAAAPTASDWPTLFRRIEAAPPPVAAFIERRSGCNHFWGEAGSGFAPRERQVQARLRELRCNRLEPDERALRKRFRKQPEVLRLLRDTRDIGPW